MDYFSVTQTAFLSATCLTFVLTLVLIRLSFSHRWVIPFVFGFFIQFCWLLSISLSYSKFLVSSNSSLLLESGHFISWFITLGILLNSRGKVFDWPLLTKITACSILIMSFTSLYLLFFTTGKSGYLSGSFAVTAGLLIIFTEQAMRNIGTARLIKLIGLCLLCQFMFDSYLYGQMAFSYSLGIGLWQTRAAIAFVTALAVSIGVLLFTDHNEQQGLTVSRPVVFYTTGAVLTLIVFGVLSIGAFYVRKLNGYIGSYLFSLSLITALLFIGSLVFSQRLKSSIEVFVSKHFFNLKYDYREQWLKAITTTANLSPGQPNYYHDILKFVCDTFKSQSGVLWLHQNGKVGHAASYEFTNDVLDYSPDSLFIKNMVKDAWIYSPLSKYGAIAEHNDALPRWFADQSLWMICPMICQMKLIGMIAISRPKQSAEVTFEDRDLMTNLIDQISSQILLHQQESVISSNKQMETYNRLSAFIMHDVNNVIAQLALIVRNAEKHKNNPAFIEDMIKTVHNSVDRMHGLVQKFKPESSETLENILVSELIQEIECACSDRKPTPEVQIDNDFTFTADRQKIMLAIKNIVRNAQEATPNDGSVIINASKDKETHAKQITIIDTGEGMSLDFINNELFRPFATTKAENGVGIGAHLTRSYLEHIGASLVVESKVGAGSRFSITFS